MSFVRINMLETASTLNGRRDDGHAGKTLSQQAVAALDEARRKPKTPHANRGVVREQTTDFQTENQAPGWPKTGGLCLKVPPPSDKRKKGKKTTPAMEKWLETSWF